MCCGYQIPLADYIFTRDKKTVQEFYIINDKPELHFFEGVGSMTQSLEDSKWCIKLSRVLDKKLTCGLKIYKVSGELKFEEVK